MDAEGFASLCYVSGVGLPLYSRRLSISDFCFIKGACHTELLVGTIA